MANRLIVHADLEEKDSVEAGHGVGIERVVPVDTLIRMCNSSRGTEDYSRDGFGVVGFLLRAWHFSMSSGKVNVLYNNRQSASRRAEEKGYDRIYTFADLLDPTGACFAVICKSSIESSRFIGFKKQNDGVGDVYCIEEPLFDNDYLGSTTTSIPLLCGMSDTVPMKPALLAIPPTVSLRQPDAGCTLYFCERGVTVALSMARYSKTDCEGFHCDHHQLDTSLKATSRCACFNSSNGDGLVVEMDVNVPCSRAYQPSGVQVFRAFRSRRLSTLFVADAGWSRVNISRKQDRQNLRTAVREIVEYVNDHGGFTIVGWSKTGEVVEANSKLSANQPGEVIGSGTIKPHLVYLMPTNLELTNNDELLGKRVGDLRLQQQEVINVEEDNIEQQEEEVEVQQDNQEHEEAAGGEANETEPVARATHVNEGMAVAVAAVAVSPAVKGASKRRISGGQVPKPSHKTRIV